MHPSKSHNHTPPPEDATEHGASPELTEQLEAMKAAMAEVEDICAEFAVEMYMEAKRLSKEIGE